MKFSFLVGKKLLSAGGLIAALFIGPVAASDMVSGTQLKNHVREQLLLRGLESNPVISASRKFRACAAPLEIKPMFGGYKTINLTCPDADGFKIAVRTQIGFNSDDEVRAKIFKPEKSTLAEFVVLQTSLQRGEIINVDDVMLVRRQNNPGVGYFHNINDVVGRRVKRAINVNQIVRTRHLELDYAIHDGQYVVIESKIGLVSVVSSGIAIGDAQIGERVKVKNNSSGVIVEGIAVSEKKIRIRAK